jgi:hypothetical protein
MSEGKGERWWCERFERDYGRCFAGEHVRSPVSACAHYLGILLIALLS